MIFHKSVFCYLFIFAIVFSHIAFSQVIFRDLPNYKLNSSDQFLFDISSSRDIIPLNGTWKVYTADDKKKEKVNVTIPSVFEGKGEFVFEKSFSLSSRQIDNHKISLNFFGLNYSADISVNNAIIYRHPGGEFPFSLPIPRDLLRSDKANIISVKLFYELDALNTIPLKQRFLFPQNSGGIIRDVYLHLTPNVSITDFSFKKDVDFKSSKAFISLQSVIDNKEFRKIPDSLGIKSDFVLKTQILSKDGANVIASEQNTFRLEPSKRIEIKNSLTITSPVLWSPENPYSYIVRLELYQGDQLVDKSDKSISLYSLQLTENNFILNGKDFHLYGVTYSASDFQYGSLSSYERMEKDLTVIKQAGFNAVRFARELPHPYYLRMCEKLGLLAFVELPISNLPEGLAASQNFVERSKNYLSGLLDAYTGYSAVAGIGFGSGYLFSSDEHRALLSNLAEQVKKSKSVITYTSFFDFGYQEINNLDFYGIELLNKQPNDLRVEVENLKTLTGGGKIFIGEATYIVNIGQTDGYVNKFSYEAQAKFFDDMFSFYEENNLSGFFVNTMYDIRGNYRSIVSGYNNGNVYNIGLISEDRNQERLAFKILSARMKNTEKVTIPIGSEKDDAP
ncbi:MAG: glycoside hydrolase family 2 TIM barrel-domain containing protein, partial [Ignavibacteriaceae bacterium]|nr:glycoside hydrolase family 2 TIM barrel-domain containing protein [Ignavibacteriaceae bacterium]